MRTVYNVHFVCTLYCLKMMAEVLLDGFNFSFLLRGLHIYKHNSRLRFAVKDIFQPFVVLQV